jgi:DNA polymerase-3 subunit delta
VHDWKSEDQEQMLAYVAAPTPSTVLVMLTDKLDGRTKFASTVKKRDLVVEAVAPPERELGGWLEAEAKRRGTSFAPGAAAALVLAIGADLGALSDALDRLQLLAGARAITDKDIDEAVANVREASQFELPDAIADRKLARSLSLVHDLIRQREPALLVLTFVARQMRLLARARDAVDRGEDLGAALKLPPFVVNKLATQSKRWSTPQLLRALKICATADARLKSGGGTGRDARMLEELVLALAGSPGMGEAAAP